MRSVHFRDVEVIDEAVTGLVCRVGAQRVTIPLLLLQPGTTITRRGDHGTLVIPRWLGIGIGLVWPLPRPEGTPATAIRTRHGPRRAAPGDRGTGRVAGGGGA